MLSDADRREAYRQAHELARRHNRRDTMRVFALGITLLALAFFLWVLS